MKSRDANQLNGKYLPVDKLGDCDPIIKVGDLWKHQQKNLNGQPLKENDPAIPCGLVAKSVFNDTFELYDSKNQRVKIVETGIAWSSDIQYKFKNLEEKEIPKDLGAKSYKDVQWFDMQDGK